MSERENILGKIRALLSKTVENGCTEHEAFAALAKARAIMDAYEVTDADVELKGEEAVVVPSVKNDPHKVRQHLAMGIGRFTDCKVWIGRSGELNFCGLQSDAEFAHWLTDHLSYFVLGELANHLMGEVFAQRGQKKRVINGFTFGCIARITARMDEIIRASRAAAASNSRALVIAKAALVNAKVASLGLNLRKSSSRARSNGDAYAAGENAGNRASFGRPVSGGGAGTLRLS